NFRVLGKVLAVNTTGTGVDLLRRSVMGQMPTPITELLEKAKEAFSETGMAVDRTTTVVDTPLIQVLPLAIFT
ncbi:MAG: hypothetical protein M3Y91_19525, partial [Actinomycetota bacterium]|nr:hypothetical protein [Actinomycetota bacterium]